MSKPKRIHIENTLKRRIERTVKKVFLRVGYVITPFSDINNERVVEYQWVFRQIKDDTLQVLDVGSSGTDLSANLASQCLRVVGIDFTRKIWTLGKTTNFTFVSCDARYLPFIDQSFDSVIAVSTVDHIGIG